MNKRVTGIGGVFFKAEDPEKLKEWYKNHMGFNTTEWGCSFFWKETDSPEAAAPARTEWSPFKNDTAYFHPSEKPFMFNYRTANLVELINELKQEGVQVLGEIEEYSYGKFAWIMDPEGNKIELWEPKDEGF
jgi:predicted enzyme related to lactoylglutathione lyase